LTNNIFIAMSYNYITKEGLKKLEEELHFLKTQERPRISQQIAEARDKGDLSENAEYDAAREAQGLLEMRIAKLEELIRSSKVVDASKIDTSKVSILSKVKVRNNAGKVFTYWIVPEAEANLKEGKISLDSPIAKGLLGKKVNEKVEVIVPAGKMIFEILEIER
jgi:transcription elongation factor GreA